VFGEGVINDATSVSADGTSTHDYVVPIQM
jgi:hypothetical protein